jgi:cellulose synthase/poly-beta-1,6-N-acetylglucosamine synthase-like glycosyltransferase/peptidoglycan/xylan/chitin deacetylase (PgdA/CDA1 family)
MSASLRKDAPSRRRDPRAHWAVVGVVVLSLVVAMFLRGYAGHDLLTATPSNNGDAAVVIGDGGAYIYRSAQGTLSAQRLPARTVALTFDDGPDAVWTPQILAILEREHVPATFFVIGSRVMQVPNIVSRELADGFEIGSDTFTRTDYALAPGWGESVERSLNQLALEGAIGETTSLLRPQYATTPDRLTTADVVHLRSDTAANYTVVLYDRDSGDATGASVSTIVHDAVVPGHAGTIVLFHDGGGDRAATVRALPAVIAAYRSKGYRFATVTGGLGMSGLAALRPVTRLRHWQGLAVEVAMDAGYAAVSLITLLLLVLTGLAFLRTVVLAGAAARHSRLAKRRFARRHGSGARDRLGPVAAGTPFLPLVSVIVPAYNEAAGIEATVRSLVGSDYPDVEVVVCDDGSTDGTAAIVESLALPQVVLVRQHNSGKAVALNTGVRAARDTSTVVVMVDGDTVFERDTLRWLVEPLFDPSVGAVSGNTKVANRSGLVGRWQHLEYVSAFNLERRLYDLLGCMITVPGAIGAFRRSAVDAVGGLSTDTLAEDTDLTMALVRGGWRVVYQETARAWTEAPANLSQLWLQRYRWSYGTMQAAWKHRRATLERGPSARLGRIGLPYLFLFQVLLPLIAPVIDIYFLYGLLFLDPVRSAIYWLSFLFVQMLVTGYALRLDHEPRSALWALPLQQFVYRQLMYLVVIQSVVSAFAGVAMRWHKLARTGIAAVGLRGADPLSDVS